jgi:hypothetical protein
MEMIDEATRRRCNEIRELMQIAANNQERPIFIELFGEEEGSRLYYLFLHDVSTCPPQVIAWCQTRLNARR